MSLRRKAPPLHMLRARRAMPNQGHNRLRTLTVMLHYSSAARVITSFKVFKSVYMCCTYITICRNNSLAGLIIQVLIIIHMRTDGYYASVVVALGNVAPSSVPLTQTSRRVDSLVLHISSKAPSCLNRIIRICRKPGIIN